MRGNGERAGRQEQLSDREVGLNKAKRGGKLGEES